MYINLRLTDPSVEAVESILSRRPSLIGESLITPRSPPPEKRNKSCYFDNDI